MSLDINAAEPATTHYEASSRFGSGTHEARERFDELTNRDLLARAYATLKARGEYDPQRHGDGSTEPLTAVEHLEVLAAGELLAQYYRHPARIDKALDAGVTWQQVADATDVSSDQARQDYRSWAAGQHRLWADYEGKFGMSDAEYAAALRRSETPAVAPEATASHRWRQDSEARDQPCCRGRARGAGRRAHAPGLCARPTPARHPPAWQGEDRSWVAR